MKRFETTWFYIKIAPILNDSLFFISDQRKKLLTSWWLAATLLIFSIITFLKIMCNTLIPILSSSDSVDLRYSKVGIDILEKILGTWLFWYTIKLLLHYYSPQNSFIKKLGYSVTSMMVCLFLVVLGIFYHTSGVQPNTSYYFFSAVRFFLAILLPVWSNNRRSNYYLDRA